MTKKHFIALADKIKLAKESGVIFTEAQLGVLGAFCAEQNPNFKPKRWHDYIDGKCGKNGGKVK